MYSKKGVSPLVATILLVAFSVGLGALVMSWGEEYIEQKAEFVQGVQEAKSGCESIDLSFIEIGGKKQICKTGNTIELWFDNGPAQDIYNIHARVAGTNDILVDEEMLEGPLTRENSVKATLNVGETIGDILQLKLTPKIYSNRKIISCPQKSIVVENIPNC